MNDDSRTRSLISYDHETPAHKESVREFCRLLRAAGLDVRIDADVEGERQDWSIWAPREIEAADRVLVVVSARYCRRFASDVPLGDGRGVEIEAKIIRDEIVRDPAGSLRKFVPVLLPGTDVEDIPKLLQPHSATRYRVSALTADGIGEVVGLLRGRPSEPSPPPPSRGEGRNDRAGALWLAVTNGAPAAVEEVVDAFSVGDRTAAVVRYGAGGGAGALLTGAPQEVVAQLLRITRTLPALLTRHRRSGSMPLATVGGDIGSGPGMAAAGAQWMATGRAARLLHHDPRVGAVMAVSPDVLAAMADVPAATLAGYREYLRDADEGAPVYLSAPGLARCPDLPPDADRDRRAEPGPTTTVTNTTGQVYVNSVDRRINVADTWNVSVGRDAFFNGEGTR